MSLVSAAVSLLAILALSAMTIAPGTGAEVSRFRMQLGAAVFSAAWLGAAFWARWRGRAARKAPPPQWLGRALVVASIVYLYTICTVVLG